MTEVSSPPEYAKRNSPFFPPWNDFVFRIDNVRETGEPPPVRQNKTQGGLCRVGGVRSTIRLREFGTRYDDEICACWTAIWPT